MILVYAGAVDGGYARVMYQDYLDDHGLDPEGKQRAWQQATDRLFGADGEEPSQARCAENMRRALRRDDFSVLEFLRQPSRFYGHDVGDLVATAFITNLAQAGNRDLGHKIRYVSRRLQETPEAFDLRLTLGGPRARTFSVTQPQTFLAIEKR